MVGWHYRPKTPRASPATVPVDVIINTAVALSAPTNSCKALTKYEHFVSAR